MYELAMMSHIAGTIVLFVGLALVWGLLVAALRAAQVSQVRRIASLLGKADLLLPLGAGLLLLSGLYMLFTLWGWDTGWAVVSLAGLLAIAPLVPLLIVRNLAILEQMVVSLPAGKVPPSLDHARYNPALWLGLCLLTATSLSLLYLMVTKPATPTAVMILVSAIGVRAVVTLPLWRRRAPQGAL